MNSIVYIFCCSFSLVNIIHVTPGSLGPVTSPLQRSRVVAFDIDHTLCEGYLTEDELKIVRKNHPECPILFWTEYISSTYNKTYEKRNLCIIAELLTSFWGAVKFEALKSKGQFDILSKENMRAGNETFRSGEGIYVKDLKAVIREGETLSDVILVEDDPTYVAYDQKPFLKIYDLLSLTHKLEVNHTEKAKDEHPISYWERKSPHFVLNSGYFMIGVFKTYFENEKYKILPFREALNVILPEKNYGEDFFQKHLFAYDMFDLGLSEVQKRVPNASFYGLRHPYVGSYDSRF
ncbi:uncharacterized protein LOC135843524 [Planococcus citri]|uniref:uncharacterized protein LOC135843524 n=1 Tax=Planococcus citri TaxID=170843 RepID=UPI0031F9C7C0